MKAIQSSKNDESGFNKSHQARGQWPSLTALVQDRTLSLAAWSDLIASNLVRWQTDPHNKIDKVSPCLSLVTTGFVLQTLADKTLMSCNLIRVLQIWKREFGLCMYFSCVKNQILNIVRWNKSTILGFYPPVVGGGKDRGSSSSSSFNGESFVTHEYAAQLRQVGFVMIKRGGMSGSDP